MMRSGFAGIFTNLLLSALTLAWGIVPPAVRHGHEGGEAAHHGHAAVTHHARVPHAHHQHGHSAGQDSSRAGIPEPTAMLGGYVVHLHWCLLGVGFSVPVPEHESPEAGGSHPESAVVRLVASVPSPCLDSPGGAGWGAVSGPPAGLILAAAFIGVPSQVAAEHPRGVPLCDRARRERSGVLQV